MLANPIDDDDDEPDVLPDFGAPGLVPLQALRDILLQIQSKSLYDTVLTQQGHAMMHEDEETKLYVNADVHKVHALQGARADVTPLARP